MRCGRRPGEADWRVPMEDGPGEECRRDNYLSELTAEQQGSIR